VHDHTDTRWLTDESNYRIIAPVTWCPFCFVLPRLAIAALIDSVSGAQVGTPRSARKKIDWPQDRAGEIGVAQIGLRELHHLPNHAAHVHSAAAGSEKNSQSLSVAFHEGCLVEQP